MILPVLRPDVMVECLRMEHRATRSLRERLAKFGPEETIAWWDCQVER